MDDQVTFKDLTFSKKLEHIWIYYRVPILVVLIGAVLLISLVKTLFFPAKSVIDVIMVDSNANAHTDTTAFDAFLERCGIEPYEGAVNLNTNISFYDEAELAQLNEMDQSQAVLSNYDKEQILFTLMAAGNADIFFGKGDVFLSYAEEGMFRDLTEVLSPELLARYQEQLIYTEEHGVRYPCAVALKDNPWLAENGYYTECYFGVLYLSDSPEVAAQFAEFLLTQ